MIHTKLHSFTRLVIWSALGALLVGYVLITPPAISGEMYRWVDEQGRVHLTDTPPQSKGALQELQGLSAERAQARLPTPVVSPYLSRVKLKMTRTKPGGTVVIDAAC